MKVVVSDPKTGKAYQVELEGAKINRLIGKSIGDTVEGDIVGLRGYELLICGGTDKDGFPQRRDLPGPGRKKILLAHGTGYRPKRKGVRRRKMVRGREISPDIAQVNVKIVKYGVKPPEELLKKEE
ncbi:MAG: 30S ribosomal protein S6e [Candidatus Syntropharchaeia archaeon]